MKCKICGNAKGWMVVSTHDKPDKYEKWVGLSSICRSWVKCFKCGFLHQVRNYPLWQLEHIYKDGYRDPKFRGESIAEAFNRLYRVENSENEQRYIWFAMHVKYSDSKKILDIGSGIGLWPKLLHDAEYEVICIEENRSSIDFINQKLAIKCYRDNFLDLGKDKFDTVSLIHVLEHMEDPDQFLRKVRRKIRQGGYLFVEIPDAEEFDYLPIDHDEFNSCHVSFFDMPNLYRLLDRGGFRVTHLQKMRYEDRNLTRIMCLATNKS